MRDVKYFLLLRSTDDVGTPFDGLQWAAVLRSASAPEMHRKRNRRISPKGVVDFLMVDREFPRAIQFCLPAARDSLHAISGTPIGTIRYPPKKLLGQLCSDLSFTTTDEIVKPGPHEYVDDLQTKMNQVSAGIFETFFAFRSPEPTRECLVEVDLVVEMAVLNPFDFILELQVERFPFKYNRAPDWIPTVNPPTSMCRGIRRRATP
jgi:A predicted alpha-helical domain with a conserved ER motif.